MASINNLHAFSSFFYFSIVVFFIIDFITVIECSNDFGVSSSLVILPGHVVLFSCEQWANFDVS